MSDTTIEEILEEHLPADVFKYTDVPYKLDKALNEHALKTALEIIEKARHIDIHGEISDVARYDESGTPIVYLRELTEAFQNHYRSTNE